MIEDILLQISACITTGNRHWKTVLANHHLTIRIALDEVIGIDIAQLTSCLRTYLDWHVAIAIKVDVIHAISQFIYTGDILGNIHGEIELEVLGLDRCAVKHQLNTLVGNLTCIHPLLCPRSRYIYKHSLVLGLGIIIGEIKSQTVLQELHLKTPLEGRLDLWFQVAVLLHGLWNWHTDAILIGIRTGVVEIVWVWVLTYLSERQTSLGESHPRWQRMVDRAHEIAEDIAHTCTWIEERTVVLWQGR